MPPRSGTEYTQRIGAITNDPAALPASFGQATSHHDVSCRRPSMDCSRNTNAPCVPLPVQPLATPDLARRPRVAHRVETPLTRRCVPRPTWSVYRTPASRSRSWRISSAAPSRADSTEMSEHNPRA